jgi:membrane protease subunit HflC
MDPIVKEAIRNEITKRTLQEVVAGERANLAERFVEVTNQATESLGIEVVDVRIKRIDLPEDSTVLGSVFERMRAERKRVANELRAQGTEASETIRSNADRNRAVIMAEAERDAQRLRGEGDAKATEIYAKAYGRDAEFYAFHRSLESYRQAFSDGKSVMVLDPSTDFFKYFEEVGARK